MPNKKLIALSFAAGWAIVSLIVAVVLSFSYPKTSKPVAAGPTCVQVQESVQREAVAEGITLAVNQCNSVTANADGTFGASVTIQPVSAPHAANFIFTFEPIIPFVVKKVVALKTTTPIPPPAPAA
jgi:hypothetical protein